jgi:hypothetical protein
LRRKASFSPDGIIVPKNISEGSKMSDPTKPITIRVFVEDGVCHAVFLNNPNPDLALEIEAELYDGDGDYRKEYVAALAQCDRDSAWKPIA